MFACEGGGPDQTRRNVCAVATGTVEELGNCDQTVLEAGEALTVVTPTDGGYDHPDDL